MTMTALVTGCAGFIGSHLAEALAEAGNRVVGIDAFTDFYPRATKEQNLSALRRLPNFSFHEVNLLECDLDGIIGSLDAERGARSAEERGPLQPARSQPAFPTLTVFHLAAQPGVRQSWGQNFRDYVDNNIMATQRLLEWAKDRPIRKFVFASSSSVYGNCPDLPMREDSLCRPISPYGATKLACEHLCGLYGDDFGVPVVMLRYFTVYGPRQRPDMAFRRFAQAMLEGREVVVYGDGSQTREFTYVGDVVNATLAAARSSSAARVFNVGGGTRTTLRDALGELARLAGRTPRIRYEAVSPGDVRDTQADISRATAILGYRPVTTLRAGLAAQVNEQRLA